MLTPKTDFLGTGPILYVCEIVFGSQETPIFCHNLSYMILIIYAILSLKAITLAPGWVCLLLIVTKLCSKIKFSQYLCFLIKSTIMDISLSNCTHELYYRNLTCTCLLCGK